MNREEERLRIGQRIADLRKQKGMTQQDLADITGNQRNHISRIESGKYSVGFDTLQAIAEALGGTIDIVVSLAFMLLFVSCGQSGFGKGGSNAEQFVRENAVLVRDDIASIETVREDSVLGDTGIGFQTMKLLEAGTNYLQDNITRDEYAQIINEATLLMKDIQDCWDNPSVVGDSLRSLGKYSGMWRKAYTVEVTMNSSVKKTHVVLMDEDGTTPRMTERDFASTLDDFSRDISRAINNL